MFALTHKTISPVYYLTKIFSGPLEAIYTLLIFILSNELGATPFQLILIAATKPLVSLFAFQASFYITKKSHNIRFYLVFFNCAQCLPCFLFPFIENIWFFIASYVAFMIALRSIYPAWTEIFKSHLSFSQMSPIISIGSSINFLMTTIVPLFLSFWMDHQQHIWKWLFLFLGSFHLFNVCLLLLFNFNTHEKPYKKKLNKPLTNLISDWKEGLQLVQNEQPFFKYLILFFLGGAGLVALQPVLPIYFKENLHLSYIQLTLAISLCKGLTFMISSPLWARLVNKISLFSLNALINLFSCFFIIFLYLSNLSINSIFIAYLFYGIVHAGSEMSFNMSAPIFSKERETFLFSRLNLFFLGIRGCICPFIGQVVYSYSNFFGIFIFALAFTLISIFYAQSLDRNYKFNEKLA